MGTNGTTTTKYSSTTVTTRNITIAGDSYLAAGSILKAKSIIAANSYIGDKKYSTTTLATDLLVPKDAITYFRKHYPYPGQLKITLASENENSIEYSVNNSPYVTAMAFFEPFSTYGARGDMKGQVLVTKTPYV